MNILKLYEFKKKCVNFYKTPKHNMTQKNNTRRKKYEHNMDTRITRSNHEQRLAVHHDLETQDNLD